MLREGLCPRDGGALGDVRGAEWREVHVAHQIATVTTLHWRIGQLLGREGEDERERERQRKRRRGRESIIQL